MNRNRSAESRAGMDWLPWWRRHLGLLGFTLLAILLVGTGEARAQETKPPDIAGELRRIAGITDDAARLRAYDALAKGLTEVHQPAATQPSALGGVGKWRVAEDRSKMDDSRTVVLTLDANDTVSGWPNEQARPTLIARYKEGRIECYIVLGLTPNVERGDTATITVRFDERKAEDVECSKSTDGKAVFVPDSKSFIRSIADAERLRLRFTPFNSSPVVTEFDLRGFRAALVPFEKASGWSISDQKARLGERLRSARFAERNLGLLYTSVEGDVVTTEVEGERWKSFARNEQTTDSILATLKMVAVACEPWPEARFRVTVHGTLSGKRGGGAFTSEELGKLAQVAMEKAGWGGPRYELVVGKNLDPELYGDDAPEILRGKVKKTGEKVIVEVLGVGE